MSAVAFTALAATSASHTATRAARVPTCICVKASSLAMPASVFRPETSTARPDDPSILLLLPQRERAGGDRAADHARNADLDLAERRGGDAADRDRADPDLAPGREFLLVGRAFALELLERGGLLTMQRRHVDGLGRVDHLAQDRLHRLRVLGGRALEHVEQIGLARGIIGERVFRGAAEAEPLDAIAILRPRQHGNDAQDRLIAAGREVIAPQHVEQFWALVERRLAGRRVAEESVDLLEETLVRLLERHLVEARLRA